MAAGHWRSKQGSHIFSLKHKTQMNWKWGVAISSQHLPAETTSSRKAQLNLLRVPQAPSMGPPNCWPSAQIHEPMRDISYANHHSLYIYFWGFVFDLLLLLIEFSRLYVFSVSLLFEVQGLVFFNVLLFPMNCFISDPCFPFGLLDI